MAHGGRGEAVNTADCGSVMRGFDPHPPPQFIFWGVAKSVRHRTLTPACVGSSPAAPATLFLLYGALAQLVEHLTFNQGVPSSSLGCITRNFKLSVCAELFLYRKRCLRFPYTEYMERKKHGQTTTDHRHCVNNGSLSVG